MEKMTNNSSSNLLDRVLNIIKQHNFLITTILVFVLITFCKLFFLPYQSNDYLIFLEKWWEFIQNKGVFSAFGYKFADYTMPYLYVLGLGTVLQINSLIYIKLVSIFFDCIIALYAAKIIKIFHPKNHILFLSTIFLVGLSPTIIANGSIWAQCDVIFTSFIVISLYYFLKEKDFKAILFYSLALNLKLQAIFILPFYLYWAIKNPQKIKYFLTFPFLYLIFIIPALIQGRSFIDLISVYINQAQGNVDLSLSTTNFLMLFDSVKFKEMTVWFNGNNIYITELFKNFFLFLAGSVVAFSLVLLLYIKHLPRKLYIDIMLIYALIIPYVLPKMHERYFFIADILAIIWSIINPKYFWIGIVINFLSLFSYFPFLFFYQLEYQNDYNLNTPFYFHYMAMIMLGIIIYIIKLVSEKIIKLNTTSDLTSSN